MADTRTSQTASIKFKKFTIHLCETDLIKKNQSRTVGKSRIYLQQKEKILTHLALTTGKCYSVFCSLYYDLENDSKSPKPARSNKAQWRKL